MKTVSGGFVSRLAREEQSFCYIATITRSDGQVIRLADCVDDIVVAGETYLGDPGFEVTSVTSASFGTPSSADMSVGLSATSPIQANQLNAGYFDGARIVIAMADYLSTDDGVMNVFRGRIAQVEQVDTDSADLRLSGFAADLLEIIVESFGPDCHAPFLGHPRCGFDIASLTRPATVASVIDARNFTVTVTEPLAVDGWFSNGAVKFTGGANDGLAFDIREWTQSTSLVSLWLPPYGAIEVGDTLDIAPGCDKTSTTCQAKFSNILNFQGFPFDPTQSQLDCSDVPFTDRPPVGSTIEVDC